jgi:hypothetical protein
LRWAFSPWQARAGSLPLPQSCSFFSVTFVLVLLEDSAFLLLLLLLLLWLLLLLLLLLWL